MATKKAEPKAEPKTKKAEPLWVVMPAKEK